MKERRKIYEDKLDEHVGKMAAQLALFRAAGAGVNLSEADIEYYKNIQSCVAAEEE